eukprot:Hpha_TRINITY_DN14998_c2_g1::TRINITY_DN14998_c2_g1_i1::g.145075::m.145075
MDLILNHDLNGERQARRHSLAQQDHGYQAMQVQARRGRPRDYVTPKISGDKYFEIDAEREHVDRVFQGAGGGPRAAWQQWAAPAAPPQEQFGSRHPRAGRRAPPGQGAFSNAPFAVAPAAAPLFQAENSALVPVGTPRGQQQPLPGAVAGAGVVKAGVLDQQNELLKMNLLQAVLSNQQREERDWEARHAELRALSAANLQQSGVSFL